MDYDVAIVGASIAGSTAANILGKAGLRVAVFDKSLFPRRKPCGEGLSRIGLDVLDRLGVGSQVLKLAHNRYRGYRIISGNHLRTLVFSSGGGIGIQRSDLDHLLFESVLRNSSVQWFQSREVRDLDPFGKLKLGRDTITARYVLVADGSNSRLAKALHVPSRRAGSRRIGVTVTFVGAFQSLQQLVHIFVEDRYEVYCTPLSAYRLNMTVLAAERFDLNIRDIVLSPRLLRRVFEVMDFQGELELPPMGRAPIGNVRGRGALNSLMFIGDSCEELDPIGGMGMSHALRSGELAAQAIMKSESELMSKARAISWYLRSREDAVGPMRMFTKLCYHVLRTSRSLPVVLDVAASRFGSFVIRAACRSS